VYQKRSKTKAVLYTVFDTANVLKKNSQGRLSQKRPFLRHLENGWDLDEYRDFS